MIIQTIALWPDRNDVTLTTYLHENSSEFSDGRKRPAILVCPGGGYCYCSDREAEPVALRFAAMGYHAFVLRYSVAGRDPKHPNNAAQYPKPLLDAGKAFLTIREHAEDWFLDPDRITVCGFSAGGHLAASLATQWHEPLLRDFFQEPPEKFRPAAAILAYALLDIPITDSFHAELNESFFTADCNVAMFGCPEPTEEVRRAASPVSHVSEQTVPVFMVHAANDFLVPCENALNFAAAMVKLCLPCELHLYETGSHGFSLADATTSTFPGETDAVCAKWPELAHQWLQKIAPVPLRTDSDFASPSRSLTGAPPPPTWN